MHNAVVETIAKAYGDNGWSTLRFNFRGAGRSDGLFDNGIGELSDLDGAIGLVQTKGVVDIELAGYSFGAWVMACWARNADHDHLPMRFIAPPVAFIDFKPVQPIPGLRQVVIGTGDDFAPLSQCESLTAQWNPEAEFNVIPDADHFFWNQMDTLQNILQSSIPHK